MGDEGVTAIDDFGEEGGADGVHEVGGKDSGGK